MNKEGEAELKCMKYLIVEQKNNCNYIMWVTLQYLYLHRTYILEKHCIIIFLSLVCLASRSKESTDCKSGFLFIIIKSVYMFNCGSVIFGSILLIRQ